MVTQVFGAKIKRREDPRLMTGRAQFVEDVTLPGMTHLAMLRSPYGHARITKLDVSRAKQIPGVLAVYSGADLVEKIAAVPCAWLVPGAELKIPEYRSIATEKVRFLGDVVAAVVAENRYAAEDALESIEVEYEELQAVVDQEKATQEGAPQLYDDLPNNVAFHWHLAGGDADAALDGAEVKISRRITNQRLIPTAMETRGAVANYNPGSGDLVIWMTSQNPHIHRLLLAVTTGIPESQIRVLAQDVGGGFGSKIPFYSGEMIATFASKELGRPVKWIESRRENYVATTHGRDHITYMDIGAQRDGTVTAVRVKTYANMGAYLSTAAPGVPTWLYALMLGGPYTIENVKAEVFGVMTNTTATDAYRGAGRPEATYLLERAMDLVARELNMDPVEVRRKNLVPADQFPYTTATSLSYDSGNYQAALDLALEMVDYNSFRQEQEAARQQGKLLGIGFSTYVEVCGLAPSGAAGAMGFQGGLWESAIVRVHPTGKVTVMTGANPHGQGEKTTFAQLVSSELGVPMEDVDVVYGDTAIVPMGMGTYGSRSTAVGGAAIVYASRKIVEKARDIAAHMLEVGKEDIDFENGRFFVRGAADKVKTFQEVALGAYLAWSMPEGVTPGLEETYFFDPTNNVYPFGAHVCVVEIDATSGEIAFKRYVAVDDVGKVINPLIVDGQVHGGIVQGLAQAVYESAVYDDDGQLVTGTMMEYAVPKATMVPWMEVERTETPTPVNPMGIKGAGETGTIASTPAVVNAIIDALAPYGVEHIDMPITPQKVWQIIQQGRSVAQWEGERVTMYPRPFDYYKPSSVQEAIDLLKSNEDAKILAGGHSLLPAMKLRLASPAALVDISGIQELKNLSANGSLTIGAGVTYNDFLKNTSVKESYAALYEAVAKVGDVQVRNRGTIGGAAAHADPAADIPAALLAFNAEMVVTGPNGQRTVAADDFFVDILTTALEPDEVLTEIRIPGGASRSAYEKFAHPASGYAVCGVAAVVAGNEVRVAVTGSVYKATRLPGVEGALQGGSLSAESIDSALNNIGDLDYAGDHYASAEYRAHLTKVLARRALMRAGGLS